MKLITRIVRHYIDDFLKVLFGFKKNVIFALIDRTHYLADHIYKGIIYNNGKYKSGCSNIEEKVV